MDKILYTFLVALLTRICNNIWSILRYLKPSSPGLLPEQNWNISPWWHNSQRCQMLVPDHNKSCCCTHPSTESKRRNHTERMTLSCASWNSCKLLPKEAKNKEVLPRLKEEVKPLVPIEPKVPFRIAKLTTAFLNTSYALPPQKEVQALSLKITSEIIWLLYSNGPTSSTNVLSLQPKKLNNIKTWWLSLKNKNMCITKVYTNKMMPMVMLLEKSQKQYKPTGVSQIFAPHYFPTPKKPSPSTFVHIDIIEIHAPIFNSQIDETPQKLTLKRCPYQCWVELVDGSNAAFTQCWIYCSP